MCLITFAYHAHPEYKLVLISNRDEFYQRPAAPAHFWKDRPFIIGGRDLEQSGTWLAASKEGKFAAVTNFRDPSLPQRKTSSRGELPVNYLSQNIHAEAYLEQLSKNRQNYAGYNILFGDKEKMYHYNNIYNHSKEINKGIHGISNHTLDTPWPKVNRSKQLLQDYLYSTAKLHPEKLFEILTDAAKPEEDHLPKTGIPFELEKALSPIYITTPDYGTRASTILLIDDKNHMTFIERSYYQGEIVGNGNNYFSVSI